MQSGLDACSDRWWLALLSTIYLCKLFPISWLDPLRSRRDAKVGRGQTIPQATSQVLMSTIPYTTSSVVVMARDSHDPRNQWNGRSRLRVLEILIPHSFTPITVKSAESRASHTGFTIDCYTNCIITVEKIEKSTGIAVTSTIEGWPLRPHPNQNTT